MPFLHYIFVSETFLVRFSFLFCAFLIDNEQWAFCTECLSLPFCLSGCPKFHSAKFTQPEVTATAREHVLRNKHPHKLSCLSALKSSSKDSSIVPKSRLNIQRWLCHPDFLNIVQCPCFNWQLLNCFTTEFLLYIDRLLHIFFFFLLMLI